MKKETLILHLDSYANLLLEQISKYGYCGEFISDNQASSLTETRLLCQTRGIFFLIDYAKIKNDHQYIKIAEDLVHVIQNNYYDVDKQIWTQYPVISNNTTIAKDKMLYEYAFVITAYAKLYGVTQNAVLLKYIDQVRNIIFSEYYNHITKFNYLEHTDYGVNQNALMHLFESLLEVTNNVDDHSYKSDLQLFGKNLLEKIYNNNNNLIREYSNKDIYEPGHSFEWASLIYEAVRNQVFDTEINYEILANKAEEIGTYSNLAISEYRPESQEQNQEQIRIWPSLERIRYYAMTGQNVDNMLEKLINVFFSEKHLPYEYVAEDLTPLQNKIKATTGYHIINCYKYLL